MTPSGQRRINARGSALWHVSRLRDPLWLWDLIGVRADKPGFDDELLTARETVAEGSRRTGIAPDRVRSFH